MARIVWGHLQNQPGKPPPELLKDLRVAEETAAEILELWERLGVLIRRLEDGSYRAISISGC